MSDTVLHTLPFAGRGSFTQRGCAAWPHGMCKRNAQVVSTEVWHFSFWLIDLMLCVLFCTLLPRVIDVS